MVVTQESESAKTELRLEAGFVLIEGFQAEWTAEGDHLSIDIQATKSAAIFNSLAADQTAGIIGLGWFVATHERDATKALHEKHGSVRSPECFPQEQRVGSLSEKRTRLPDEIAGRCV